MTQSGSFRPVPRGSHTFRSSKIDRSASEPSCSAPPPTAPPSTRLNAVTQSTSLAVLPYTRVFDLDEEDTSQREPSPSVTRRTGTNTAHRPIPSIDSDDVEDSAPALSPGQFRSKLAAAVAASIFRFQRPVEHDLFSVSPSCSSPLTNPTVPASSSADPASKTLVSTAHTTKTKCPFFPPCDQNATVPVSSRGETASKTSLKNSVPVTSPVRLVSETVPEDAHAIDTGETPDVIQKPTIHQWDFGGLVTQGPRISLEIAHTAATVEVQDVVEQLTRQQWGFGEAQDTHDHNTSPKTAQSKSPAEVPDVAEEQALQWSFSDALFTQDSSVSLKNAHTTSTAEVPDAAENQTLQRDFPDTLISPPCHEVPESFRAATKVLSALPLAPPPRKQGHPLPSTPFAHTPKRRGLRQSSTTFSVPRFISSSSPSSSQGDPARRPLKTTLHKFLPITSQQHTTPKGFKKLDWNTSTPDRPVHALGDGFSDVEALPTGLVQVPLKRKFRQPTPRPSLGPLELTQESIKGYQPWQKAKPPSQPQPKRAKFSKADGSRRKQDLPDDDPFSQAPLPMTFRVTKRMPKEKKRGDHEIDQSIVAPCTPTPRVVERVPAGNEPDIDPCSPVSLPMTPRIWKRQVKKRDAEHEAQPFSPTPSQNRSDDCEVNFDPFISSPLPMPWTMGSVPRDYVIPQSPDRRRNTVSPELGESDGQDGARGTQLGEDPMEGDTLVTKMQLEGGQEP